jgi:hypothetical protein
VGIVPVTEWLLIDAPPEVEPEPKCEIGPEGHDWRMTVTEGHVGFGSGCDQCDDAVLGPIGNDALEMPTEVVGKIKFTPEHPNLGGWHGDMRCDCGYWWEFTPARINAGETTDASGRLWTTDHEHGCQYVYVHGRPGDRATVKKTVEIGMGVMIDYDADGQVLGIEFIL